MALNKADLMAGILKALNRSQKKKSTASGNAALARGIASAVDKYVKAGTVNTVVATTGTKNAQAGTGVGKVS